MPILQFTANICIILRNMQQLCFLYIFAFIQSTIGAQMDVIYEWKYFDWEWKLGYTGSEDIKSKYYIPENVIVTGIEVWHDQLFIVTPRLKAGVPSSVNFLDVDPLRLDKSPQLSAFPFWDKSLLSDEKNIGNDTVISAIRVRIDPCNRIWVIDTGTVELYGNKRQLRKASIIIYDLRTRNAVRIYELTDSDVQGAHFSNIEIDVDEDTCDDAYAVISDLLGHSIVIYSYKENSSWRIRNNYFFPDPMEGDFYYYSINFQWPDGVLGLALSEKKSDGYRRLYFQSLCGIHQFSVSMEILRNSSCATDTKCYQQFKYEGVRGEKTQTTGSAYDVKTKTLFWGYINKNGIAYWNTETELSPGQSKIAVTDDRMIYPSDVKIHPRKRDLWVISNKLPMYKYNMWNVNVTNFRLHKQSIDNLIE